MDQPEPAAALHELRQQIEELRLKIASLEADARTRAEEIVDLRDEVAGAQRDQQDLRTARARMARSETRGLLRRIFNRST